MKTILLFAIACLPLNAQRSDTITQTLFTSVVGVFPGAGQFQKIYVQNIGQPFHQLTVTVTDAPGQTCVAPYTTESIEGSFDKNTFVTLPSRIATTLSTGHARTIQATGAYQWIRVNVVTDKPTCAYSAFYSGNINPAILPSPVYSANSTLAAQSFSGLTARLNVGDGVTASPRFFISDNLPDGQAALYGLLISVTEPNTTITLKAVAFDGSLVSRMFGWSALPAGTQILLPVNGSAYFVAPPNTKLVLDYGAATTASITAWSRLE